MTTSARYTFIRGGNSRAGSRLGQAVDEGHFPPRGALRIPPPKPPRHHALRGRLRHCPTWSPHVGPARHGGPVPSGTGCAAAPGRALTGHLIWRAPQAVTVEIIARSTIGNYSSPAARTPPNEMAGRRARSPPAGEWPDFTDRSSSRPHGAASKLPFKHYSASSDPADRNTGIENPPPSRHVWKSLDGTVFRRTVAP